jgi:catechol 2,3-dioxygenase-like lactoylglutathione lyase family enzyme
MPFTALDHVGYAVSDVDRSVAWYANLLQVDPVPVVDYGPDYLGEIVGYPGCRIRVALLPLPTGLLELIEYVAPPPSVDNDLETYQVGNAHLCLVTSDLAAEYERLKGVAQFRSPEPVRIRFGAYAGALCCYLRDPDGITVELVQF